MTSETLSRPAPERGGYRANLQALLSAQKPARGTAAYSRYVNRPAGRRVAAALHTVGCTPNTATAISATLSAAGLVLLATVEPSWWLGLAVAVLLAAGYVMDSVDGQLARLRGGGSLSGEYLDHSVDVVKTCALHLAVLISLYRFPPVDERGWLLVPVAFLPVDILIFFGVLTFPLLRSLHGRRVEPDAAAVEPPRENPLRAFLILPTDYGTFCWMFVLLAVPTLFLAAYTAMFVCNALVLVPVLAKWWGELRSMDRLAAEGGR